MPSLSVYKNGKKRIRELFSQTTNRQERIKVLVKECGIGGHSVDYMDGSRGFVEYNGKGISLSRWDDDEKKTYQWKHVERMIDALIQEGRYDKTIKV